MKFSSLGSGSKGNALLICTSDSTTNTRVLLDCGFSIREMEKRLTYSNINPSSLSAIIVTHEHIDHARSAFSLAKKYHIPIWMSYGTFNALGKTKNDALIHFCKDGDRLDIGDLEFTAFTVPHDAKEPLQFHVTNGRLKLGVLTDLGKVPSHVTRLLHHCDALILECNHDPQMLINSSYPSFLKSRIRSDYGHLSNEDAIKFIEETDTSKLKKIIAAHLSQQNNCRTLVQEKLETITKNCVEIIVACQDEGFNWIELS